MTHQDAATSTSACKAGAVRRVFLATPARLASNGIGAIFLRDLIASQPGIDFTIHEEPPFLMGAGATTPRPSLSRLLRAASTRLPWFHTMRLHWFETTLAEKRAKTIATAARATAADRIWVTASSPEMIWIAERLAAMDLPLHVTVWDAPEYLSGNLRLGTNLHAKLMDSFQSLVRRASAVSVIGRAMQQEYRTRYGIASEIIRHGIDAAVFPCPSPAREDDGCVRIVFAGSLYAKEEWNSFTEALQAASWRIGDRPVALHFVGRFPLSGARKPKEVIYHGEKTFEETLEILSSMDIGYLPYWFDKRHEIVARTSFPSKLSAYVAAGLAVFHHAPAYTETTAFLEQYPLGVACPSLEVEKIMRELTRLMEVAGSDKMRSARLTGMRDELSREAIAVRFRRFLARSRE